MLTGHQLVALEDKLTDLLKSRLTFDLDKSYLPQREVYQTGPMADPGGHWISPFVQTWRVRVSIHDSGGGIYSHEARVYIDYQTNGALSIETSRIEALLGLHKDRGWMTYDETETLRVEQLPE